MVQIRILSAQPTKDGEQWKITAARHNDDWYVDSYQQNPTPFYRNPFASPPNRPPFPWRPNASFRPNDPLLPGVPAIAAYANPAGGVIMLGALPVNQFSALTNAPQVPLQASVTSGSGTQTFYIALSAIDANGKESQASNLIMATGAVIGSTITISGVVWDSGATGYTVYYGPDQLHMWQVANVAGSTPGTVSATITAIDGIGMPDAVFSKFRIVVTPIRHGGIWGSAPTVVGSFSMTFPGASAATNDYAGRIISFYGSNNPTLAITAGQFSGYVPQTLWSFAVTSNTSAGVMTLATNPALYFAGDAFVVRAQANIASANSIGDAFFVNPYAPSGLTVNAEAGKVVWIMAGTGKGQYGQIVSNTNDTLFISGEWAITPDSTSSFIILEPLPVISIETNAFSADGVAFAASVIGQLTLDGSASYLIQVITEDANGKPSPAVYAPFQELFVYPDPATAPATPFYTVPVAAGTATPDCSRGDNLLILTAANCLTDANGNLYVNIAAPINYSATAGINTPWTLIVQQDPTTPSGGYSTIFDSSYKVAFAVASTQSQPNTQCHVDFRTDSTGKTTPTGSLTDQPV